MSVSAARKLRRGNDSYAHLRQFHLHGSFLFKASLQPRLKLHSIRSLSQKQNVITLDFIWEKFSRSKTGAFINQVIDQRLNGSLEKYQEPLREAAIQLFAKKIFAEPLRDIFNEIDYLGKKGPSAESEVFGLVHEVIRLGNIVSNRKYSDRVSAMGIDLGEVEFYPIGSNRRFSRSAIINLIRANPQIWEIPLKAGYIDQRGMIDWKLDLDSRSFLREMSVPAPLRYAILGLFKRTPDGSYHLRGEGYTLRGRLLADAYCKKSKTIVEIKYCKKLLWLSEGGIYTTKEGRRVHKMLNQARKYGRALKEGRIENLEYHLTASKIHPKALRDFLRCFPKKVRHKVKIYLYADIHAKVGRLVETGYEKVEKKTDLPTVVVREPESKKEASLKIEIYFDRELSDHITKPVKEGLDEISGYLERIKYFVEERGFDLSSLNLRSLIPTGPRVISDLEALREDVGRFEERIDIMSFRLLPEVVKKAKEALKDVVSKIEDKMREPSQGENHQMRIAI